MSIFETSSDDPLGLWTPSVSAATAPEAVSFSIGDDEPAAAPPDTPVFRVNLPADGKSAAAAFDAREEQFVRINAALDGIPTQIDDLVARKQQRQAAGVSFAAPGEEEPESELESNLFALLEDAEKEGQPASGEVSFALGEEPVKEPVSQAFLSARAGLEALVEQFNREVLHYAWVETNIGEQRVAQTVMNWSGDAQTVWIEGVNQSQIALHNRTLKIATQTRNMRLRMFTTIAGGAAKLAGLMATPGGAILALPAVYQFVKQIVAQTKQLQSIQST
jgi:hypothetical protein